MTKADVELYDKLHGQLLTMRAQFEALSKKNPNDVVNEFIIGLVNKLLVDINGLIGNYKPFPDFELFENGPIVFNSDVLLILAHYLTAMNRFKPKSVIRDIRHETPTFLMTAIRKLRMYSVV